MGHGYFDKEDNSSGQVENVLESEKTGNKEIIHHLHICLKQNTVILDFSIFLIFVIQSISQLC